MKENWFLRYCLLINLITGITGALSSFFHLMVFLSTPWGFLDVPVIITRIYFIGFGIMVLLTEREWSIFFKQFVRLWSSL